MWILLALGAAWAIVFVVVPLFFQRSSGNALPDELMAPGGEILPVQVLFAQVADRYVTIDCVLMAEAGSREAGSPFSLRINRPDHPALDGVMTRTLCDFAERLATVDLRFAVHEGEPQVRIASEHAAMRFDLDAAA